MTNVGAYIFRGYKISEDAISMLSTDEYEALIDSKELYFLNYRDEGEYIFGRKIYELPSGTAKAFDPYEFETCLCVSQDRELMLKAMQLFKGHLPHTYPKTYFGVVLK